MQSISSSYTLLYRIASCGDEIHEVADTPIRVTNEICDTISSLYVERDNANKSKCRTQTEHN